MINAEKLVQLLARKRVVSPELAEGLLKRIAQSKTPISAEAFAKQLVDRGTITRAIADNVLRILDQEDELSFVLEENPVPKTLPKPPPQKPVSPPKPSVRENVPLAFPTDLLGALDDSLPGSPVSSTKKARFKKAATNPWDSKLLLYGGGGILLLLMLSTLLYFAIYRRGADEYLNAANAARDSGNYSEAMKEYADYLKNFPNHTGAVEATIRLSLSRMRLITDAKNDWHGALTVAKEEIAKIVLQPDYRKEAEPELTAMLPTIAENLALLAKDKKDVNLLADAEEAMLLIQKYVPVSSQPVDRIQKAQVNIDFTKREIAKDERLVTLGEEIRTALENADISSAYEKMTGLQIEYPGIENDSRFVELLKQISENEKQAVRFVERNTPAASETTADNSQDHREDAQNVIILANRKVAESNATQAVRSLYVYATGSVFAVRSTDGKILWKKTVGGSSLSRDRTPSVIPLPVSAEKEDVLLVDYRTWELVRLDAVSGDVRFRVKIGEPFRLAGLTPNKVLSTLYLTTESGKCFPIDVQSGQVVGHFQFPQKTNVAPFVDETNKRILQLAFRTTLYVCPLKGTATEDTQPMESLYLGHLPGTIRTAPFLFGPYLLTARQTGPGSTALQVYEIAQTTAGAETKLELKPVQSLPLRGAVETAPVVDGRRLFLATNAGIVYLFQWDDDPTAKVPLKLLAEGAPNEGAGSENDQRSSPRYLGLFDRNLWVAGQELIAYEVQQSRNRLVPLRITDSLTTTLAPLWRIENTVFRTFRYQGQSGTVIKAFSLADGKPLWETQLADPFVEEPTYHSETKTVRAVTQSGKLYRFPLPSGGAKTLVFDKPIADLESEKRGEPVRALVPLAGELEAWIETKMIGKSVAIYDPNPTNPRPFRFIPTAEKIQTTPVAFGDGLLTPLRNGAILFFDPKTGKPFCEPFAVKLSPTEISQWSAPVVLAGKPEFLVLEQSQSVLYRVAVEKEGDKNRFCVAAKSDQIPERSDQLLASGETAFVFSTKAGTAQEVALARMSLGRIHDFGNAIVWGPYEIGESDSSRIVLATSARKLFSITAKNGETAMGEWELLDAVPRGKPILRDNRIIFMSLDGTSFQADSNTNTVTPLRETGVPTELGPFFFERQTGCVGRDGCIYLFPE
ncbi:MAG: PQQ-like beta-propeller repeat protein [Planctomycetaceae bacterium]|nr:PQQ-like beta-propeller repeat protein [Planctomycetaceae bacterium]